MQAVSDLLINELFNGGNWYAYEWPEGMSYVSLPLSAEVISSRFDYEYMYRERRAR